MAKKEKNKSLIVPLQLRSVEDMARYAYNFDFTYENVFMDTSGTGNTLYALGERLGDMILVYTVGIKKQEAETLFYTPPERGQREEALLLKNTGENASNAHKVINILKMPLSGLGSTKRGKPPKIRFMKLGSLGDLVKLAIRSSAEALMHVCCFEEKGKLVFYGLDLLAPLDDEDAAVYYATSTKQEHCGFAMYNYASGDVALTNAVGEHTYMYLKVINLAEKPAFFTAAIQ